MLNTDYPVHAPSHEALRSAFGSLQAAYSKTGGSLKLAQFLLANPALIARAEHLPPETASGFAATLREAAAQERIDEALRQAAMAPAQRVRERLHLT